MDFLLDLDSDEEQENENIKNQLIQELNDIQLCKDNESLYDQRSVLDDSIIGKFDNGKFEFGKYKYFIIQDDEHNEFNQSQTWKDFMKGNVERDEMLRGIEQKIQQVKKITQGCNEIEIDDDLNFGLKKTIQINPLAIQQTQIDEIREKVIKEQTKTQKQTKIIDQDIQMNSSSISFRSHISLRSMGTLIQKDENNSIEDQNKLLFNNPTQTQSRFLNRNNQKSKQLQQKNYEQETKMKNRKQEMEREKEQLTMEMEDQRSFDLEIQIQKQIFRLRNYQLPEQFPSYKEQIHQIPLISLGCDELPSAKRFDIDKVQIKDIHKDNLANKNSFELTKYNILEISKTNWFNTPLTSSDKKAMKFLESANKLELQITEKSKKQLDNSKNVIILNFPPQTIIIKDQIQQQIQYLSEEDAFYNLINCIHSELVLKYFQSFNFLRILQTIEKIKQPYISYKLPFNKYENFLTSDIFKSFDQEQNQQFKEYSQKQINLQQSDINSYMQLNMQNILTKKLELKMEGLNSIQGINKFKKLSQIILSSNLLSFVDPQIYYCQQIIEVDLSQNKIETYEALGSLKQLRILSLEMNQIKKMQLLKNSIFLEVYNLNGNQIQLIQELDNLIYLKKLIVFKNQLRSISGLNNQYYLEELDLGSNQINSQQIYIYLYKLTSQSDNPFLNCYNLRTLYLYNNNLIKLPKNMVSLFLSEIWLQQNGLENLDGLEYLPSLQIQILNAQDNQITCCISSKKQICFMPHLKKLNLSRNKLESFGSVKNMIRYSSVLQEADYRDNPFLNMASQVFINQQQKVSSLITAIYDDENKSQYSNSRQIFIYYKINSSNVQRDDYEFFMDKFKNIMDDQDEQLHISETKVRLNLYYNQLEFHNSAMKKLKALSQRKLLGAHEFVYTKIYKELFVLTDIQFIIKHKDLKNIITNPQKHIVLKELRLFELWHKYSMVKVKNFLKKWIRVIKKRNNHYKININLVIKVQAFWRGRWIRNKFQIREKLQQQRFKSLSKFASKIQKCFRYFMFMKKRREALKDLQYDIDEMEEFDDEFFSKPMNLDYGLKIPNGMDITEIFQKGLQTQQQLQLPIQRKEQNLLMQTEVLIQQNNNFLSSKNEDRKEQTNKLNIKTQNIRKQFTPNLNPTNTQELQQDKQMAQSKYSSKSEQLPNISNTKKANELNQQKIMEEWGFTNPDVAKAFAYRMDKDKIRKDRNKQKNLTAEQRFQQFQKNAHK